MLFTQSPKVVQSVGIQVGGIFLEPKVISLPTNTNTIGTQCNEEVLTPKKTERQLEHESQIQKLKSSLQMAYKVKHNNNKDIHLYFGIGDYRHASAN